MFLSCAGQWACESRETESGGSGWQRKAEQDWSHWGPPQGGHQDQPVPQCSGERHQCPGGLKKRSHTISGFKAHTAVAGKSLVTTQAACLAWSRVKTFASPHCAYAWAAMITTEVLPAALQKHLHVVVKLLRSLGHASQVAKRRPGHSVKLLTSSQQSLWCLTCSVCHLLTG